MNTAYLEATIKNYNFQNLETGDLVKFQADISPIIYHYGIIERVGNDLFIYHNQASFVNRKGGSLIREDFKKYATGRKIIEVTKTHLTKSDLSEISEILKDKKYHFLNNNCEHFVNKFRANKFVSPQAGKWAFVLSIFAITILIMKRK